MENGNSLFPAFSTTGDS